MYLAFDSCNLLNQARARLQMACAALAFILNIYNIFYLLDKIASCLWFETTSFSRPNLSQPASPPARQPAAKPVQAFSGVESDRNAITKYMSSHYLNYSPVDLNLTSSFTRAESAHLSHFNNALSFSTPAGDTAAIIGRRYVHKYSALSRTENKTEETTDYAVIFPNVVIITYYKY